MNTNRDCAWTAQSTASWIVVGAPREGQGEGRVTYSVAPNDRIEERRGMITVSGATVELLQAAAPPPPPPAPNPPPAPQPGPPAPAPTPAPPTAPTPAPAPQPTPQPPAPSPAPNPPPTPTPAPNPPAAPVPGEKAVEVKGRINDLSGSCPTLAFTLSGRRVVTDRDTDFKKLDCGDLRPGMEVQVKGKPMTDGSILAEKVERD